MSEWGRHWFEATDTGFVMHIEIGPQRLRDRLRWSLRRLWRQFMSLTEPLQPGDEQEAENGAPPPIPDPPDTDPVTDPLTEALIEDSDRDRALVAEWDNTLPPQEETP